MTERLFPPAAFWIGTAHPFDLHEVYLDFLSPTLILAARPKHAELFITADSRYRLWLNGHAVARGPARSYPWHQSVDRIDVAPYLQSGANAVAVQVYQPGYSHFAYTHRGAAGLLVHLVCDGCTQMVTSADWRVRRNPSFASLVPRVSIYGSGVEDRDLRLDDDWSAPGYDSASWSPPRIVAPLGGYPWLELHERVTPLLAERELPLTLVEVRTGHLDETIEPHVALRTAWQDGAPAEPHMGAWATQSSEGTGWLFDLGRAYACQGWVEIEGAVAGQTLLVSYAEKTSDGQLVISDPDTYCRVRMTDRYRLRTGSQLAEPFSLRGGRYLLFWLSGRAADGSTASAPAPALSLCRLHFHARTVEYPLGERRRLATDDPQLQQIAQLCEETLVACLQDSFVDSAWRESSLWLGDALPQALTFHAMTGDVRPLRQALKLAVHGAYPDGVLPGVLAGEVHAYAIVDYNFMWVELLSVYLEQTGDSDLLLELWPSLVKLLDRFHADLSGDGPAHGLIVSQPGRRLFLDWAPVSRREPSAIYNLHYLLALQTAIRLAQHLARHTDERRWQARARVLRQAIRSAFCHDGRCWDDLSRSTCSQLAAAFAVLTGTALPGEEPGLLDQIIARSLDLDDTHRPGDMVLASPFMHHYLFEALRSRNRADAVITIIRVRWGRWAAAGYPTAWENWSVDFPDGSQCHAFSAHPRFHLSQLALR
jgi:hypothetical protein